MTPAAIAALSDAEVNRAIAEAEGWRVEKRDGGRY